MLNALNINNKVCKKFLLCNLHFKNIKSTCYSIMIVTTFILPWKFRSKRNTYSLYTANYLSGIRSKAVGRYKLFSAIFFGQGFLLLFFSSYTGTNIHGDGNGNFPYYVPSIIISITVSDVLEFMLIPSISLYSDLIREVVA
jgi:hypothetical protein